MTMNTEKLIGALKEIGEPPCTGCKFANACAAGLACKDYQVWVGTGRLPKRPKDGNRTPRANIYAKIFEGRPMRRRPVSINAAA